MISVIICTLMTHKFTYHFPNQMQNKSALNYCLTDILFWMECSKLKLNPNKTDLIIIGTKQHRNMIIGHFPVKLLGSDTFPSDSVCNLGVVFDSDFNFRQHISQVCKSCFYHIRDLHRIRRHISLSTAKTISTALISIRLDYCNSLLNDMARRDSNEYSIFRPVWYVFLHHYHYLNSYTGFLLLIEYILNCPLLHIVLYLHNNHPTWLVSDHQFHNNLLCLRPNLTCANVLSF